jgi:imidazoleglycerol-phosphate dehydratase
VTQLKRETKETKIELSFEINGTGKSDIQTGVGFFDHMLEALAKHSLSDVTLRCEGDLHVDYHHTVEDIGIVIGEALHKEIFPVQGVERFANTTVILDEAAVEVDLDLSGRPFLLFDLGELDGKVGEFDAELAEEFFRAVVYNAKISAHIVLKRGKNRHHILEAAFKAFAVALRRALAANSRISGAPSTKGVL